MRVKNRRGSRPSGKVRALVLGFMMLISVSGIGPWGVAYAEEYDDAELDASVDLSGITNEAERAAKRYHPVSNPEHAAGMIEAQEIATKKGIRSSFMICPDGFERYFDENGEMVRDRLLPDRSAYVDIDGIKLDPKDNNINKTFMKYASHGRRALAYDKSSHYMELWVNGVMTRSYMVTSGAAEGDKKKQGDYRTPLGYFYICDKKVSDSLKEELYLNYPNIEDAKRGLKAGLIDRGTAEQLIQTSRNLQKPTARTRLGGAIEVHGNGELMDATRGCIGVYNEWNKEIYDIMQLGDRVYIVE
ncbi:hypothetical protein UYO_1202 [Lachnospiraceae bacterium JC7]|nr:hypothetical protein UYO_1202 [Lachnospiraceae bacterium JC7]